MGDIYNVHGFSVVRGNRTTIASTVCPLVRLNMNVQFIETDSSINLHTYSPILLKYIVVIYNKQYTLEIGRTVYMCCGS